MIEKLGFENNIAMAHRPTNPTKGMIFLDSCAFDPKYSPEDAASRDILDRSERCELRLQIAHSTQKEIEHPNTPSCVKRQAAAMLRTLETGLTPNERTQQNAILSILAGNGNRKKVAEDAEHIFQAGKWAAYFVTTDMRILRKAPELQKVCEEMIVKPTQLLEIIRKCTEA